MVEQKIRNGYKQTELGIIPEDWIIKKISDFTDATSGGTPSTFIKEYWNGDIRWMNSGELNLKKVFDVEGRITELGLKKSATKLIPKKCILIGLAGQGKTRGTVAMNYVELCINQSIGAILPNESFDPEYLYYNLDSRYKELRKISTGGEGRGGLNLTLIRNISIPLPPTVKEQSIIKKILQDLDHLLDSLETLIQKKKNIKQGAMQELLTGKRRLDGFSGEWETKRLGELLNYEQPTAYLVQYTNYDDSNTIPVLTAGKSFILGYTNEDKGIFQNYPVIIFDDFTTESKFVEFPFKVKSSAMKILKTRNNQVNLEFVFEMMQIINFSRGGHKRYWLSEYQFLEVKIPKLNEQKAISKILSDMDSEIEQLENQLNKYTNLKQAMIQKLLTGEIRLI